MCIFLIFQIGMPSLLLVQIIRYQIAHFLYLFYWSAGSIPAPLPLVTVCPSVSSFVHVMVSFSVTVIWFGTYHCLGPTFVMSTSGFAAPLGIVTLKDSPIAWTSERKS